MNKALRNIIKLISGLSMAITITFSMSLFPPVATAQVTKPSIDFNHMKTGFPLTGAHARVECETCHVGGLFRGTSTNCEGCHSPGRRVIAPVKSISHMPTNSACNTCHLNAVSFLGARFNHIGVLPKACTTCHNGKTAPGKPNGHVVTTESCDTCHRTSAWLPSGFNHSTVVGGSCETCHTPGGMGRAKPAATHLPTTAPCDTCHKSGFTTFLGASFDHLGSTIVTPTNCATCHLTGQYGAKTKPLSHIPTSSVSCNTCHTTGYINFTAPIMSHALVEATIQCSTCHNGSYKSQKGTDPGLGAQSKADKTNHVATTAECGTCHLTGRKSFSGANYAHLPQLNNCNTCHYTGGPGIPQSLNHITTALQCDSAGCHSSSNYTTFGGIGYTHDSASIGKCGTCHLGQNTTAKQKPITHIPTIGNACDSCHAYVPSGMGPTGGFLAHLPTKAQIHATSVPAIACATCHSGGYTNVKARNSATHVATTAACDNCHTLSNTRNYTDFLGATFNHASVTTTAICGTCHTPGGSGLAKTTPPHIPTTGNACDACHSVTKPTFAGATMNHLNVASQACITCHGTGNPYSTTAPALVKLATPPHIPTNTLACENCHSNKAAFTATMNHPAVTGTVPSCTTCHNGSYTLEGKQYGGAQWKSSIANHIPVSKECNVCHTGFTSFTTPLVSSSVMHTAGIAPTTCVTCHITGSNYKGVTGKKMALNHRNKNPAPTDCSESGCHRPGGSTGSAYTNWN